MVLPVSLAGDGNWSQIAFTVVPRNAGVMKDLPWIIVGVLGIAVVIVAIALFLCWRKR